MLVFSVLISLFSYTLIGGEQDEALYDDYDDIEIVEQTNWLEKVSHIHTNFIP